ncbi:hypothetical protein GOFOIKOB_1781 [Methylobacterium tardum]|nr:hypothetical protein GOFOIKOB_1781 [Methylobacterium tardum]
MKLRIGGRPRRSRDPFWRVTIVTDVKYGRGIGRWPAYRVDQGRTAGVSSGSGAARVAR